MKKPFCRSLTRRDACRWFLAAALGAFFKPTTAEAANYKLYFRNRTKLPCTMVINGRKYSLRVSDSWQEFPASLAKKNSVTAQAQGKKRTIAHSLNANAYRTVKLSGANTVIQL
jgi:hypothetical protein